MFIRYLINILLLLVFAHGAWQVITGNAPSYGWQRYYYLLSPWLLLLGSVRSWYRCFTWRRMIATKPTSHELARGQHKPSQIKPRRSILEHACIALMVISIAAIGAQMGFENAAMYIAVAICSYVAISVTLWMVS